jgi:hypothetical protein
LGEPDTFRLRYRKALIDCVGEAIRQVGRGDAIDTGEVLLHLAKDLVPESDLEHFLKITKEEIAALHEGYFAPLNSITGKNERNSGYLRLRTGFRGK